MVTSTCVVVLVLVDRSDGIEDVVTLLCLKSLVFQVLLLKKKKFLSKLLVVEFLVFELVKKVVTFLEFKTSLHNKHLLLKMLTFLGDVLHFQKNVLLYIFLGDVLDGCRLPLVNGTVFLLDRRDETVFPLTLEFDRIGRFRLREGGWNGWEFNFVVLGVVVLGVLVKFFLKKCEWVGVVVRGLVRSVEGGTVE